MVEHRGILDIERVVCKYCGLKKTVVKGHLTEEGKRNFICYSCASKETVEGRVEARREDDDASGRRLLVEE